MESESSPEFDRPRIDLAVEAKAARNFQRRTLSYRVSRERVYIFITVEGSWKWTWEGGTRWTRSLRNNKYSIVLNLNFVVFEVFAFLRRLKCLHAL